MDLPRKHLFCGRWKGKDDRGRIDGLCTTFTSDSGNQGRVTVQGSKIMMEWEGESSAGMLENGRIVWDDGDVWEREVPSAAEAEALRQTQTWRENLWAQKAEEMGMGSPEVEEESTVAGEEEEDEEDEDPDVEIQRRVEEMESQGSSEDIKELAVCGLRELFVKYKGGYGIYSAILGSGVLSALVRFLREGTEGQKEQAAGLLASLAHTGRFGLTRSGSTLKLAVRQQGGFAALVTLLQKGSTKQQEHSAQCLEMLAEQPDDRLAILEAFGGIAAVVPFARRSGHGGTDVQREFSIRLLRMLQTDGHEDTEREAGGLLLSGQASLPEREAVAKIVDTPDISIC